MKHTQLYYLVKHVDAHGMLLFPSVGVIVVSEFNAPSTAKVQALFNRIHIEFPCTKFESDGT